MNKLIERLREEAEWYSGHVKADRWRLSTVENKTRKILIEAADTLLALQTQLAAAELKAKEWIDVAYEAASQKEELKRELERVERALQNFIDIDDACGLMVYGNAGSELVVALSKAREALPSAKTATETE